MQLARADLHARRLQNFPCRLSHWAGMGIAGNKPPRQILAWVGWAISTNHKMIFFSCRCGNVLFFENTTCLQCQAQVGYDCSSNSMVMLDLPNGPVRCQNGQKHNVCNWVVSESSPSPFCPSCRLNRMIPDLTIEENVENWREMESAKRRALYSLLRVKLFPKSKTEQPEGLAFDFLMPTAETPVLTGHKDGVITLNVREADDSFREKQRHKLGEPYRTLVGHFRHELGHYFWDRFFKDRPEGDSALSEFRRVFGDERADYADSLKRHYAAGAPADWNLSHVSAYATSHPWEDWAETWAQYLHMQDGLETARSFGWSNDSIQIPFTPFAASQIHETAAPPDPEFLKALNEWLKLSPAINEMAAGLGHPNLYPFVFSVANARKLFFVHHVVTATAQGPKLGTPSLS